MADQELSDEQAQSLGLDDSAPPAQQPGQQMSPVGINGAPPMHTRLQVKDPESGSPIPDDTQRELSDDQARELGLDDGPNTKALQFVAQHGDLSDTARAGQIIKYSAASGLPTELVKANFDNVKKLVDSSHVNWDELAQKNPGLAQFMAADPAHIPLAVEDHKHLSMLEWAWKAPTAALLDAIHSQGTIAMQTARLQGVKGLDEKIQKQLDEQKASAASFGNEDYGAENYFSRLAISTVKMIPYMALDAASRYTGGAVGALAAGAAGLESGPGAVGTAVAGGAAGEFGGSFLLNYEQAAGPLSWQLDHMVDEHGNHIDPKVANAAAQMAGVSSGLLMAGLGPLGNKYAPGISKWAGGLAQKGLAGLAENSFVKWIADNEVRTNIAKLMGRWGIHVGTGAAVMAANSGATQAAVEAAKVEAGFETDPLRVASNVGDAVFQGAKSAIADMPLLALHGAYRDHLQALGRERLSAESQARLDTAVQAASESTTLAKAPEAFKKYVDIANPNGKVYVPANRWVEYFQGKKLDPAKMAESAGVKPEELQKAIDTGGNVEFKASDFLTQFAQTEHAQGLTMDIKSEPTEDTKRESQELVKAEAKRMVEEQAKRADELNSGKRRIEDFLVSQAKASKLKVGPIRQASKILAEAVGKRAIEFNVAYNEAARMMNFGNLTLTGKAGPTPEHEGILKSFNEWLLPSATTQGLKKLESMSGEARASLGYLDTNAGVPNEKHFRDMLANNEKDTRQIGNVSIEGIKHINNNSEHDTGNLVYRAAAKALHDAAPDAHVSKTGGDFELRVNDQAHLDEILKKAQANLPEAIRGLTFTGKAAESRPEAQKLHEDFRRALEDSGERAKPGEKPKGLTADLKDLKLEVEKAAASIDPELAKSASTMTPKEFFNEFAVEKETGLLNNLGWHLLDHNDPSYHYTALDVRGLGLANQRHGKAGGDAVIEAFGKVLSHFGGGSFDAAHIHGDEYVMRGKDPYQLSLMVDKLREHLDAALEARLSSGKAVDVPVEFWDGTARGSYAAADSRLSERKRTAKASQADTAARAPGGGGNHEGQDSGQGGLERGRGFPSGRGSSPQGFPSADGSGFLNQEALAAREPPAPPQAILDMQAYVGRMKSPERKAAAQAHLDYFTGKSDERAANVPKDIVDEFAEVGLVHPDDEAEFAARGLSTRGDYKGAKYSSGNMPEELKRYRDDNIAHKLGKYSEFEQGKKVVSSIEGAPVTINEAARRRTDTPEFRNWFGGSRVVDENGQPKVVYHGAKRPDRIGARFRKSRATSGPMAFFTDSPEIAGGYATNKKDTSLEHPDDYSGWFKAKVGRSTVDLDRAWYHLKPEQRAEIAEKISHVARDDNGTFRYDPNDTGLADKGTWDMYLRESRGNWLKAAKEIWLNSAGLFDEEEEFLKVLDLGGAKGVFSFEPPHAEYPSVYPVYLSIRNPLDTAAIGQDVVSAIEKAARRQPEPNTSGGADPWDKRTRSPSVWMEAFRDDLSTGSRLAWTSIPDWVTRTLKKLGYDGIKDTGGKQGGDKHAVWVPFEETQVKSATGNRGTFDPSDPNILHQGGDEDPRGRIQFNIAGGQAREINIQLFKADASTFLHESAHFLGLALHDLAHSDLATPQIKADYDTLLKFMGYESAEERIKALATGAEKEKEEKLSHAFESYVMEGKAPSSALARVFTRFKKWLGDIYSGVFGVQSTYEKQYGQKLELSDEVRQVFDRMLAQDEALRQADKALGGTGELKEAVAGMTPDEAARYREKLADSAATADQKVAQSQGGAKLAKQRAEFEQQAQGEVDAQPVYRAWRYLEHGNVPQGDMHTGLLELVDANGQPFKLDKAEFLKQYGPEVTSKMPPNSFGKKGVSADSLASALGFNGGDDMAGALSRATPRDEAISSGTQDKMDAANGPELERLTEAALSGAHDDKALSAAVDELRGLAKQINPAFARKARAVDVDSIRANVERLTGSKAVGELDPKSYADTERRLAMQAAELWGKGGKEASYDKREQRLLNKVMFMAERDAKEELSAARDRIRSPSPGVRANLGKANPAYRDVHDSLLQAVGLAPRVVGAEAPVGLDAMLADADRDGHELGDWADTVRAILQKPAPWKSLTVDQARDVADAVKNLRHVAREENEVTIAGEVKDRKELQQSLYNRTASVRPAVEKLAHGGKEPTLMQKVASKYRGASGSLQELETFADMLDGGAKGPWNDLLVRTFLGSRDREIELIKSTLAPIKEAFEKIPKELLKLRDSSVDVASLLPPPKDTPAGYTRSYLWNIFLNMGNEGNLQRLVDGNGYTRENMLAAVSKLSEPELDFLQRVRDVANKQLFPELAKAYEARTGLPLGKVAATPITVNGKTYEGGYWPIRYDRDYEGNQGQRQEINDMKDLLPRVGTPTVTNSATKSRQAKVMAPLDLTWGTVPQHFATVIHDIAYGDAIRQVGKMLIKPRIPDENIPSANKTATDYIGKERAAELLPALRDIAADRIDSTAGHVTAIVKGTSFMRSRLTAATLMANLPSLARHLTDPLVAVVDTEGVPLPYIAAAYVKVMNPASWGEFEPFKHATELEYRHVRHNENLNQELGRMGNAEGRLEKAMRVGFKLQSWMDAFVSRIAFRGAYDHAKASGLDEAAAIQRGNDVVRRTMPSGNIAEKAPILRTKQGWASCILFYGYASKIHNVRSRSFDRLYRAWNAEALPDLDPSAPDQGTRTGAVVNVAAKMIGLGLISALGGYVSGRGPTQEEDDKEGTAKSRAEWLATETMLSPMDDAPPVVGPAIKATLLGHKTNIGSAPELMLLDHQLQKLGNLVHGKKQEDEDATWEMVANMVGLLGPLGQAQRTIPFAGKASEGREHIRGPLDFGAGVIYGDKKHQGANPLSDAQTLISGGRRH